MFSLHILKHINPPLGVPLPDLPQCLVLVPSLLDILAVDLVHCSLLLIVSGVGQVFLQTSQLTLKTLILLG